MIDVPVKVLLPKRIWDKRNDKEVFMKELKEYMKRYPGYKPLKVVNSLVICEVGDNHGRTSPKAES